MICAGPTIHQFIDATDLAIRVSFERGLINVEHERAYQRSVRAARMLPDFFYAGRWSDIAAKVAATNREAR